MNLGKIQKEVREIREDLAFILDKNLNEEDREFLMKKSIDKTYEISEGLAEIKDVLMEIYGNLY